MRISLNWLKRYVDVPCSGTELGHKLTMGVFPVPSIEAVGDDFVLDVEVTNFVMLECGQPLHAFDLEKVRGRWTVASIDVRRAEGETLTAIDGTKLVVGRDEPAICNAERPIALAGVMGGLDTEVTTA